MSEIHQFMKNWESFDTYANEDIRYNYKYYLLMLQHFPVKYYAEVAEGENGVPGDSNHWFF